MSKLKVYDKKGSSVGNYDIADDLLVLDKGEQAVMDVVTAYRAGLRAGTASTLSKGEVAGSNKKPWKQKGTGRARAGYRQSPVWRGGAVAFGPHPRSYAKKVNKKTAQLAFRRAFSEKISDGSIHIVDELSVSEISTKSIVALFKSLKITGPAILVMDKVDKNVVLSARNIPKVEVVKASDINVYQLLRYPAIVVDNAGMKALQGRLESKDKESESKS